MSYQVLARKFRPLDFDTLVGQDHVVRALRHGLDQGRLHHAYLFTGTRGVGKTTIARIVAKGLNCETGVTSTPCGVCSVCVEVQENRFLDLIEVDAASRTGVGDTRELLENAQYRPSRGRYKVYLIDEVHMLSTAAFNALLKTLEEPPEHVKFLLATTDPKKVPVTVLSRCLQFQLKNISRERIAAHLATILQSEGVGFEDAALDVIAAGARGSMRDALSIADQAIAFGQGSLTHADVTRMLGAVGRDEVRAVLDALAAGEPARIVAVCDELAERATDFEAALGELIGTLHRMAVEIALGTAEAPFPAETVQLFYQIAVNGFRDIGIVPEPRVAFEMTLLRMLAFAPDGEPIRAPRLEPSAAGDRGSAAGPGKGAGRQRTRAASAQPSDETPAGAAPVSADPTAAAQGSEDAWHVLVETLGLAGIARALAEHCVVRERSALAWTLTLDAAHDALLNEGSRGAIERALGNALGRPVRVTVVTGAPGEETPAARRRRIDRENHERAESVFRSDPTVRELLTEFGGRLEGVRALATDTGGGAP